MNTTTTGTWWDSNTTTNTSYWEYPNYMNKDDQFRKIPEPEEHYCDQCEDKFSLEAINHMAKLGMGAIIYITDVVKKILLCPNCLNKLVKYIPGLHKIKNALKYQTLKWTSTTPQTTTWTTTSTTTGSYTGSNSTGWSAP